MSQMLREDSKKERSWSVGPWIAEPRGIARSGNDFEPVNRDIADRINDTRPDVDFVNSHDYAKRLSALEDANRTVYPEEIEAYLKHFTESSEGWDEIHKSERTQVHRHRNRALCGGLLVKLDAWIPEVSDLSHVASCYLNFKDRAKWDKQVTGFRALHNAGCTDLITYTIHASPLKDRDFTAFHTILRHEEGEGILIFMRHASNSFVPTTRAVRGTLYVIATMIKAHPKGGASVSCVTGVDPNIIFLPKWIMSALVPAEWSRSVAEVTKNCQRLRERCATCECAPFFEKSMKPGNSDNNSEEPGTLPTPRTDVPTADSPRIGTIGTSSMSSDAPPEEWVSEEARDLYPDREVTEHKPANTRQRKGGFFDWCC